MRVISIPKRQSLEHVTTKVVPDARIPLLTIMILQRPLTMAHVRFLDAPFLKLAILTQKRLSTMVRASLNLASMQAVPMQMLATTTQPLFCLTIRVFSLAILVMMEMT